MEDRAPPRAFAKFADVRLQRRGGDGNERAVTQHGLNIFGNLYPDPVEKLLVRELLRASFVFVKEHEGFSLGEHGEEESSNLEIDQAAPYHPNAADFAVAEQALGGQSRAGRGPLRTDHGPLEYGFGSPRLW